VTPEHPNAELTRRVFAAFGQNAMAISAALSRDIVWRVPGDTVHLLGHSLGCVVIRALLERHTLDRPGRIVCLTSGQALGPMLGELPYATTKGALEMFVRQLAPEVMPLGITVNAVNPGVTDTGWVTEEIRADVLPRIPGGRIGEGEDAARLIAWLCSADAAWVTGQVIGSEGGFIRR